MSQTRIDKYRTPFKCVAELAHCQTADFTKEMGTQTAHRREQFVDLTLKVTQDYADVGGLENKYLEAAVHHLEIAKVFLNTGYVASVGKVGDYTIAEAVNLSVTPKP